MPVHPSWILAATTSSKSSGGSDGFLFIVVVIGLIFYLFTRSQKKARRKAASARNEIEPGQHVMTNSGIYATVVGADEDSFELEIAEGVVVRFAKAAVTRVLPVPAEPEPDDEDPLQHEESTEAASSSEA